MTYLPKDKHDALLRLVSRLVFENAIDIDYDIMNLYSFNY